MTQVFCQIKTNYFSCTLRKSLGMIFMAIWGFDVDVESK